MDNALREYFIETAGLTDDQFDLVKPFFAEKIIRKGECLLSIGEINKYVYFVIGGCLRTYTTDSRDKEYILRFIATNEWLAEVGGYMQQEASSVYIDAILDTHVFAIHRSDYDTLSNIVPSLRAHFQSVMQLNYLNTQKRLALSLSADAKERYLDFMKTQPALINTLPISMIASYIGIVPESLSRIRKQLTHRHSRLTA